ncbi:hypothetical protein PFICI_13508 [Pestalotiopsis fici W106-1]|uniref:Zinc-regulated transporter 2 n=1 Tax=Pestalotiopsis fici (strain W106-1 / CGMCC3.15140) TaxID=1229662 RepID=W3WMN4_PESFW|nr:uncharacterized protein PFICI_13508 [Pestalotiopsis fici W106-1]ETS75024.1 hypothetical protein PFICI_13508 [Pestalotiopsis fici W106-1]
MPHHGRLSDISNSARDWTLWFASVLAAAVVINIAASSYMAQGTLPSVTKSRTAPIVHYMPKQRALASAGLTEIAAESTSVHLHGLSRRDQCASPGAEETVSDLPLRIGAVFIILAVSFGACVFPILAARFSRLKMPADFFFAVRHFGTGVLLATAFVHLLPTAFILLGDPCLPAFWNEDYPAVPGAIALTGIFIVKSVEMLLHPAQRLSGAAAHAEPGGLQARSTRGNRSLSMNQSLSQIGRGQPPLEELDAPNQGSEILMMQTISHDKLNPEQQLKKETLHVLLLEMGILFHSVFIGMALSVSFDAKEFVILLVAIVFHQTFEGLALGARISAIDWRERKLQPFLMAAAYGCTTPLGQVIGLAARSAYSPDSQVGLILVGVMNALSSGLLVFASLVELLFEDLLTDESWRVLRGKRRVFACLLVLAGAFGMSLVGAWA